MAALLHLAVLPLLTFPVCSGASPWQTMTTGSHIRGEDHDKVILLSPDATFSCGFHEVGTNALTFSIWYTTSAAERTVVWTANPYSAERGGYSPVNKYGSRVSLNRDGNLILTDTNGSTVWDSKTSSGKHTTVTLLDSGNLVISDSSNKIMWQSFDSPTDTLLPGQNEHCRRSRAEREGADGGRAAARRATARSLAAVAGVEGCLWMVRLVATGPIRWAYSPPTVARFRARRTV